MPKYQPYQNNPKSVKNWLSSHMALQYNWQMFVVCLGVMVPSIWLLYVNFSTFTPIQNLIFHIFVFVTSISLVLFIFYIRRPILIPIDELQAFKNKNLTVFGVNIIDTIYYYLNFHPNAIQEKIKQSEKSPVELLEDIEDEELYEETCVLIQEQGGLKPSVIEPYSIFLFLFLIFFQWFFVICCFDDNFNLIYEPNWLKSLNDWLMLNVHFMPITGKGGWMLIDVTDHPELFQNLTTTEEILSNPLLRASVLYHFINLIIVPIQLFCLYNIIRFRKNLLMYDKFSLLHSTSIFNFMRRFIWFLLLIPINLGIIIIGYSAFEMTALPNVLARNGITSLLSIVIFYPLILTFLLIITDIFRIRYHFWR